jgi:hypothetical protein
VKKRAAVSGVYNFVPATSRNTGPIVGSQAPLLRPQFMTMATIDSIDPIVHRTCLVRRSCRLQESPPVSSLEKNGVSLRQELVSGPRQSTPAIHDSFVYVRLGTAKYIIYGNIDDKLVTKR